MAATVTPIKATGKAKAEKATTGKAVGVKELATKLGADPRDLRKFLRGMDLNVGRGSRYSWPSLTCAEVKRIVGAWEAAQAA